MYEFSYSFCFKALKINKWTRHCYKLHSKTKLRQRIIISNKNSNTCLFGILRPKKISIFCYMQNYLKRIIALFIIKDNIRFFQIYKAY